MPQAKIIRKIKRHLLKAELSEDKRVCHTTHGNNDVYCTNYLNAPNVMQEIGRLREIAFREAGGGTGNAIDIDEYDICNPPFEQLFVWDPHAKEIISSYRFILGKHILIDNNGNAQSPTAELFKFSPEFIRKYLPLSIELGRSFVQPKFQASRKGIFALDNIWDGLGCILGKHPEIEYVYGKMTMYKSYPVLARDLILYFLQKHFKADKDLLSPIVPLRLHHNEIILQSILPCNTPQEDYFLLQQKVHSLGCNIPPLVNIYIKLSPRISFFGTSDNHAFGDVEESAIMIRIKDMYPQKLERYLHHH
ncbi:MAG: GNAT family N-acetyltransferase [Bacteroidales bacterium]|nr:GNAT family N-acetyltransferase [Bacteroidales bacterium]